MEAQPDDVLRSLAHTGTDARGPVALADGTPLSRCVEHAIDDQRLQALGATLTTAADRLARRMHDGEAGDARARRDARRAALELGFLAGAVARGSARTAGFQSDLADRIASTATSADAAMRTALVRGRDAGRAGG